jgi:hypothetical protein
MDPNNQAAVCKAAAGTATGAAFVLEDWRQLGSSSEILWPSTSRLLPSLLPFSQQKGSSRWVASVLWDCSWGQCPLSDALLGAVRRARAERQESERFQQTAGPHGGQIHSWLQLHAHSAESNHRLLVSPKATKKRAQQKVKVRTHENGGSFDRTAVVGSCSPFRS